MGLDKIISEKIINKNNIKQPKQLCLLHVKRYVYDICPVIIV